jgi:hypothetical protein
MQNMMWDVKIKMPLIPARGAGAARIMSTHNSLLCGGFADFLALTRTAALLLDADNRVKIMLHIETDYNNCVCGQERGATPHS